MTDLTPQRDSTLNSTSVLDLIDDYKRRHEALQLQARELARVRGDVLGATDRAAADIVSTAQAAVRTIIDVTRRLSELAAGIQVITNESTPPEGRASDASNPFVGVPLSATEGARAHDRLLEARRDIRRLLDEALPQLEHLRKSVAFVQEPQATAIDEPWDLDGRRDLPNSTIIQHASVDAEHSAPDGVRGSDRHGEADRPATASDDPWDFDGQRDLPTSSTRQDALNARLSVLRSATDDVRAHDRALTSRDDVRRVPVEARRWIVDAPRDLDRNPQPPPSSAVVPEISLPFAGFGSSSPESRSAKPWIAGVTVVGLLGLGVVWWAQPGRGAVASEATNGMPDARPALTTAAEQWMDAYYRGDTEHMRSIGSRDMKVDDTRSPAERLPAGLKNVRRTFDGVNVQVAGDGAVVSATVTEQGRVEGQNRTYVSWMSQVWLQEKGVWRLMESRIRRDAEPQ